jgi:glycosyltransferase involved in cell wall biosynthesis
VPDVRDYYNKADVFVVPLRMGGGTKLKVLEAMAMGLPIVSTSVGAQGLDVKDGTHILIADSHERFAEYVLNLLNDKNKALEMGRESRKLVESRYSWNFILDEINTKLEKMLLMERTIKSAKRK